MPGRLEEAECVLGLLTSYAVALLQAGKVRRLVDFVAAGRVSEHDGEHEAIPLRGVVGPGDSGRPVFTVMLASED